MEASGEELGRIVAFVNRRPWLMEGPTPQQPGNTALSDSHDDINSNSNYFLDRLGTTTDGDTSLHRISAWHATPDQFQAFVEHMEAHQEFARDCEMRDVDPQNDHGYDIAMTPVGSHQEPNKSTSYLGMPAPPGSILQPNHKGVTALHVAVYRNSFHANSIVKYLLHREPSLASTPMECGTYPLHILCAHNVTIRREIFMTLLEADPTVVTKQDQNGDTPLSLLWKSVLRFRWAQQEHVKFEEEEEEEDQLMIDGISDSEHSSSPVNNRLRRPRRPSWMTVITPDQYVEYSLLMIRAARMAEPTGTAAISSSQQQQQHKLLHLSDICRMPRCPPFLIKLILEHRDSSRKLAEYLVQGPDFWKTTDELGRNALHHAARVEAVTLEFVPAHVHSVGPASVVDCLVNAFPSMALGKDQCGRIALHYALETAYEHNDNAHSRSTDTEELHGFVGTNPDSLRIKDPISGLYPFALLAAKSVVPGVTSDDIMMQDVEDEEDNKDGGSIETPESLEHFESVFLLLRQFPEAALYREQLMSYA